MWPFTGALAASHVAQGWWLQLWSTGVCPCAGAPTPTALHFLPMVDASPLHPPRCRGRECVHPVTECRRPPASRPLGIHFHRVFPLFAECFLPPFSCVRCPAMVLLLHCLPSAIRMMCPNLGYFAESAFHSRVQSAILVLRSCMMQCFGDPVCVQVLGHTCLDSMSVGMRLLALPWSCGRRTCFQDF